MLGGMALDIRECDAADHDAVIELSLRAWAPVFASMEAVLGVALARLLHGAEWRDHQARAVSETLADSSKPGWVAEGEARIRGFVVAGVADAERSIGEIAMLAVDP